MVKENRVKKIQKIKDSLLSQVNKTANGWRCTFCKAGFISTKLSNVTRHVESRTHQLMYEQKRQTNMITNKLDLIVRNRLYDSKKLDQILSHCNSTERLSVVSDSPRIKQTPARIKNPAKIVAKLKKSESQASVHSPKQENFTERQSMPTPFTPKPVYYGLKTI